MIDLHIWREQILPLPGLPRVCDRLTNFVHEEEEIKLKVFNLISKMSFLPGTASLVKEIDSKSCFLSIILFATFLFCFVSLIRCTECVGLVFLAIC